MGYRGQFDRLFAVNATKNQRQTINNQVWIFCLLCPKSNRGIGPEAQPGIFHGGFPCENFKNFDFLNFNQKFYAIFASLGWRKGFDT